MKKYEVMHANGEIVGVAETIAEALGFIPYKITEVVERCFGAIVYATFDGYFGPVHLAYFIKMVS